ncbi:MAG: SDR family oxidoreductase [Lachnospiraceae bacterium]|nr:SDR family oxidoreductase [Lachnospiraceae bacterium]
MADNYLEKRMEEYRAGKLAPKRQIIHVPVSKKSGDFCLSFECLNVIVLGGCFELASAVVEAFRKVDCRVALCHDAEKECRVLAQRSGCRYYPFDPCDEERCDYMVDDVEARWGGVDVVVDLRCVDAYPSEQVDTAATLMLLHSHPAFSFITSTTIRMPI